MNSAVLQLPVAHPQRLAAGELAPADDASRFLAKDCHGLNFYETDSAFSALLKLRLPGEVFEFLQPHLRRLGELAGGRMNELAALADCNPPVLHARDRYGRDEDWIEYHAAYRELERIGYTDFGIHAMSRTEGVLGWPKRFLPLAKYAFQYLFVQSEFGLMCPIAMTDSCSYVIEKFGDEALKKRFLPGLHAQDPGHLTKGAQLMTEKSGGSDVGAIQMRAVRDGDVWRLYGEKWFSSAADADVIMVLARPEGAPAGTKGLALFALPRRLDDGRRNAYRIVRLKSKLGTRSMPTGETIFEGAVAYLVGDPTRGLKQILDQVNLARLSHGVRAAGMMRRCLNEAMIAAKSRGAFGKSVVDFPLIRRQLLKIMLPTEQALSMFVHCADAMRRADEGDKDGELELRILTPLVKLRACRDNIKVATSAMEIRGGSGFIEEFVNGRLIRDAQTGLLWEGTSNIVALDIVQRAVRKQGSHMTLKATLDAMIDATAGLPESFALRLKRYLSKSMDALAACAAQPANESLGRSVATLAYNCCSACLLACEGAAMGREGGDARRLLLAKLVLDKRVDTGDPFEVQIAGKDAEIETWLLGDHPIPLAAAQALVG